MTTKPAETMTEGQAPGPMTGRRYLESLRDRREVWIDGERVEDVTTHPAFKDMVGELARVYDLQNSPHYRDEMTCIDPTTAQRISVSRLLPHGGEDLKHKRRTANCGASSPGPARPEPRYPGRPTSSPRSTSKTNSVAVKHPRCDFGENPEHYYRVYMSHDLFLTHALGDPQVDRSTQPQNEPRTVPEDEEVAPPVVEETRDGVVVTGGKQLSTAAPHSNECCVSLSATFARRSNPKCVIAFAFAIRSNSIGLKMLAREPGSRWFGSWGHPLKMLDEQDCMLFFDHCSCLGTAASCFTTPRRR